MIFNEHISAIDLNLVEEEDDDDEQNEMKFFKWKKILVRLFHTGIVLYIAASLFFKNTELREALILRNYTYVGLYVMSIYASLAFYFITCLKNPGYVCSNDHRHSGTIVSAQSDDGTEGRIVLRKCMYCNIKQPLRSKHCVECNRCVKKYDHHCPWLECCIGEYNHRDFWLFLLTTSICISWSIRISWKAVVHRPTWRLWLGSNIVYLFNLNILLITFLVCFILFIIHTYFMLTNTTTWEKIARPRITYLNELDQIKQGLNPFNEGYFNNVKRFFLCYFGSNRVGGGIKWHLIYNRFLINIKRQTVTLRNKCTPNGDNGIVMFHHDSNDHQLSAHKRDDQQLKCEIKTF